MSVTKHVLMLWVVAALVLHRRDDGRAPLSAPGPAGAVRLHERARVRRRVHSRRRSCAPNVGEEVGEHLDAAAAHVVPVHPGAEPDRSGSDLRRAGAGQSHRAAPAARTRSWPSVTHGGVTATGNFNVTAALATITFFAIIVAGTRAHGFVKHWKNLVPPGLPLHHVLLIPIEIMGMFVRPFALTMRLAANMTGGHIAILAILSFVFIFAEQFGSSGRHRRRRRVLGAAGGGDLGARNHRGVRSGVRVHAAHGHVHRHGHSRSSLS